MVTDAADVHYNFSSVKIIVFSILCSYFEVVVHGTGARYIFFNSLTLKNFLRWPLKQYFKGEKHTFFIFYSQFEVLLDETVTGVLKHIWSHYHNILYFNDQDDDQSHRAVDVDYVTNFFFLVWLVLPRHDDVVVLCQYIQCGLLQLKNFVLVLQTNVVHRTIVKKINKMP